MRQEETARTARPSAEELLQKAMQEGEQEEEEEEQGLVDKAKDKLMGQ